MSSALLMISSSQLSLDDFRNVRQTLMMHNSLDILLAIKYLLLDLGLGRLLPGHISRIEQRDDVRLADNNLVQRDSKKKYQRRDYRGLPG